MIGIGISIDTRSRSTRARAATALRSIWGASLTGLWIGDRIVDNGISVSSWVGDAGPVLAPYNASVHAQPQSRCRSCLQQRAQGCASTERPLVVPLRLILRGALPPVPAEQWYRPLAIRR